MGVEPLPSPPGWPVATAEQFTAFYDATFREVYAYVARLCGHDRHRAEDLTQNTYLALLRVARSGERSTLTAGYAMTAARRKFLDELRSEAREERRLRLVSTDDEAPSPPLLMLDELPDRERAAMVLRYVDDMTVGQVATELGLSVRAAESLLARARQRLRRGGTR